MGVRRDFYAGLWKDLNREPSKSFLFRFLRKERLSDEKREDYKALVSPGGLRPESHRS